MHNVICPPDRYRERQLREVERIELDASVRANFEFALGLVEGKR